MYIYHPNTKMTHKNDGFIENLMKVPAPLNIKKKLKYIVIFKSKYCFFKNSFIIVMDLIIHLNITLLKLMRLVK